MFEIFQSFSVFSFLLSEVFQHFVFKFFFIFLLLRTIDIEDMSSEQSYMNL
jgi:hypothetical protein